MRGALYLHDAWPASSPGTSQSPFLATPASEFQKIALMTRYEVALCMCVWLHDRHPGVVAERDGRVSCCKEIRRTCWLDLVRENCTHHPSFALVAWYP
jgi:hypothetical protein